MTKKWEYYSVDEEKAIEISKKHNIDLLISKMLVNRGIINDYDIKIFLNPTRNDFHDPFLFKDMDIAVDRIIKAINNNEKTVVYGDYDVDGITSITVLKRFLKERGLDISAHIPNRLNEGYGLNKEAIEEIAREKNTLMITVDCGISGVEEIDYAKTLGIETIITDHHEQLDVLPNALAIIDAKRKDNTYPFRGLAGVGVVFKLIQAIGIRLELEEKEYLKYLDIVCVGTISDIVPLVDENRVIAKLGLKLIEVTKNVGLREIIKATGYKQIDSNTISFGIAPRINACGRMGYQEEGLKLFLTENISEAVEITKKLNEYNKSRQDTEKRIFEETINMIEAEKDKNTSSIILSSNDWHHGVIGIVSSKVTDMYFKPSVLICFEGEEGKGSGRSIPGFDLHDALHKCSDTLERYGGHEMAVGLTINKNNFNNFKKKFEEVVKESKIDQISQIIYIDGEVELKDIKKEIIGQIKLLEPFGEGNRVPLIVCKNLKIDSIRALSEGKHLKLTLKESNTMINGIGFNLGKLSDEYLIGDKVDVIGVLEINSFNGNENVQINIKDIRKSY